MPSAKDIQFFDRYYDKGPEWYWSFFREGQDKKAIGELSHDYFLSAETAERIHRALPNAKLFCCLREVVDKMRSNYAYDRTTELGRNLSVEEYAFSPEIAQQYRYHDNLKPFYDRFGGENILVTFYDDLQADPAGFIRRIYGFLSIDTAFKPPSLLERVNPARGARVEGIAHLTYKAAQWLRQLGLANLVGAAKRSKTANMILYKGTAGKPDLPADLEHRIRETFGASYDDLAALIGRPLPEAWLHEAG